MKTSVFIAIFNLLVCALAYTDLTGSIKINDKKITLGEFNTQEVKQLTINSPKDIIEIDLKSKDIKGKPEQIMVSLADVKTQLFLRIMFLWSKNRKSS